METVQNTLSRFVPKNFNRVTVLTPEVSVGGIQENVKRITKLYEEAAENNSLLAVTPELSVTSYSLGDAFLFDSVLENTESALVELAAVTKAKPTTLVAGAPICFDGKLYNCAVVMSDGKIDGIVPKINLANYGEFYEKRWFSSGEDIKDEVLLVGDQPVPFGSDLLFKTGDVTFGVEICEDVWVADKPSLKLAKAGAEVILNLSASTEMVGKADKRRSLITQTAAGLLCSYVYASADPSESTSDVIMSGHGMITEFDNILAERKPLSANRRVLSADLDLDHLRYERRFNQSWKPGGGVNFRTIGCRTIRPTLGETIRYIDPRPFIPGDTAERKDVCSQILDLQAHGLKKRLTEIQEQTGNLPKIVLGLSGGLDSTLALLAAARACDLLGVDRSYIQTITMPANASSERTQDNATLLAAQLGTTHQVIPIQEIVNLELALLDHDQITQDITFENVQARARTSILFNKANQIGGLVLGTGDLSELALGWCTYNGDHMSNYAINASIPKTLVRYVVETAAQSEEFGAAEAILTDILNTPVSPELTGDGSTITQETEDLIGPYELHDFFIYNLLRWGTTRTKMGQLANLAFADKYSPQEVNKWLDVFCQRFVTQQFKRNCMPDGVKVGRISVSPRGDLRFPSDAERAILLAS